MKRGTYERFCVFERLLQKISISDGCWLWKGAHANGFGIISMHNKNIGVHRLVWKLATGRKPRPGYQILHTCKVRNCVRPSHLFERLPKDPALIKQPRALLTAEEVNEIRVLAEQKCTVRDLAYAYELSQAHVVRIIKGEST
jgi:hypothetical protein